MHYHDDGIPGVLAHTLHVERTEVEDRPLVHIEKKVVVDTEEMSESPDSVSVIEKQTTTTRRRRRDTDDRSASNGV